MKQAEPEPAATLKVCIEEAKELTAEADRLIHETKQINRRQAGSGVHPVYADG